MNMNRAGIVVIAAAVLLCGCDSSNNKGAATAIGGTKLRFYGAVSSDVINLPDGVCDFVIYAESEEKAKLWHAKYLSDLVLDQISAEKETLSDNNGKKLVDGYKVIDGWKAAFLNGKEVHLLHSPTREALLAAASKYKYDFSIAQMEVPMAVDGLEKWPMRFYYRYSALPPDTKKYDEMQNLEFCKKYGLGLIFWLNMHWADRAQNIIGDANWSYLLREAKNSNIPVGINFNSSSFPLNRFYAEDNNARQPGYVGGMVRMGGENYGGASHLSADHPVANAQLYKGLQKILKKYDTENVVSLHEVNGELRHGDHNIFLNYGPEADRSFREYLKEKYGSVANYSKLLYGNETGIKNWEEIRYPEVAEFAGFDENAINLAGVWKIKYTSEPTPEDFAEGFKGTNWFTTPKIPASDMQLFMPKQEAVLKRTFEYSGDKKPAWIYLWHLNPVFKASAEIWINGKLAKKEIIPFNCRHWMYAEISEFLRKGENTVAFRLPHGQICYKTYITHVEPHFYPFASKKLNQLWYDSILWNTHRRTMSVKTSIDAMRSIDPDKPVVLMCPRFYTRQLREIARLQGGQFHDTGGMAACFHEKLPMLMRGANLPFTLEPGGPPKTVMGLKRMFGIYMSEAVNAVHYFIHVGDVLWYPDRKKEFLRILPAIKMMGKVRQEQGDVAMMINSDINALLGYPWCDNDLNIAFSSGYWPWRFNTTHLLTDYLMDALIPDDFDNGLADRYKVILDCNNTMIDAAGVESIRRWVEKGGVYVAMFQSGRHSPIKANAWEISKLTGFKGEVFARYDETGAIVKSTRKEFLSVPQCEKYLTLPRAKGGTGTSLIPVSTNAITLAKWKDGSTAIGINKIGRGAVYTFGVQMTPHPHGHGVWFPEFIDDILKRYGARRKGVTFAETTQVHTRHFISNNGLYDVWFGWNGHWEKSFDYTIKFEDGRKRVLTDVVTGKELPLSGKLGPNEFVMGVSPRFSTARAAEHWFNRQCGDKQGTSRGKFEAPNDGYGDDTLDITYDWLINGATKGALEIWNKSNDSGVSSNINTAVKKIKIPASWNNGKITLSHTGMYDSTCFKDDRVESQKNGIRFWIDGKPLFEGKKVKGFSLVEIPVKAGAEIEIKAELTSTTFFDLTGTKGSTFLNYTPNPLRTYPLNGDWLVQSSWKENQSPVVKKLPCAVDEKNKFFFRTVDLSNLKINKGERVFFAVEDNGTSNGVMVNGMYVRKHHHSFGKGISLDITKFLKPGKNDFIIVTKGWRNEIFDVELRIYPPKK